MARVGARPREPATRRGGAEHAGLAFGASDSHAATAAQDAQRGRRRCVGQAGAPRGVVGPRRVRARCFPGRGRPPHPRVGSAGLLVGTGAGVVALGGGATGEGTSRRPGARWRLRPACPGGGPAQSPTNSAERSQSHAARSRSSAWRAGREGLRRA